ncbi:DNA-binding protein [Actinomyces naeslundii]|uniref:DNA-binding protein n=1 Tax=Actinomyces naeslundii TaxID=1655 RepID=A0ABX3F3A6_ACTNA|nr:helix-turn-helix domain-containing protein [Actinomyces naeslundii]OLO86337.1 DNA-binding protein [Actinomyces naeslundii]
MDYNATLTITPFFPVEDDDAVDGLMEAFADYHPAVGDAPASPGAVQAVITLPAHTLAQAVATATALATQVGDLEGIEVIPTQVWDRREGLKVDDIELVSVTEAAASLGLTSQAIRDRITAGTLPGRKIGRNWLVPTAALAS